MPNELILRFERERETKNTIRYQERAKDSDYVVGFLYVRKAELARLGDTRELTVSVRARRGHYRQRSRVSFARRSSSAIAPPRLL